MRTIDKVLFGLIGLMFVLFTTFVIMPAFDNKAKHEDQNRVDIYSFLIGADVTEDPLHLFGFTDHMNGFYIQKGSTTAHCNLDSVGSDKSFTIKCEAQ